VPINPIIRYRTRYYSSGNPGHVTISTIFSIPGHSVYTRHDMPPLYCTKIFVNLFIVYKRSKITVPISLRLVRLHVMYISKASQWTLPSHQRTGLNIKLLMSQFTSTIWNFQKRLFSSWYAKIEADLKNRERRIQMSIRKKTMLTASHISEYRGRRDNVEQNISSRLQLLTSLLHGKKLKLSLYLTN
jgi:hypothetical protein